MKKRRRKSNDDCEEVPQHKNKDGFLTVVLEDGKGDRSVHLVHELVAKTFLPNPDNKPKVRHKNGVITDNRAENLEWCD